MVSSRAWQMRAARRCAAARRDVTLAVTLAMAAAACASERRPPPAPVAASPDAGPRTPSRLDNVSVEPGPRLRTLPQPELQLPLRESFTVQDAGRAPRAVRRYALDEQPRRYAVTARLRARVLGQRGAEQLQDVPEATEAFVLQAARAPADSPGPTAAHQGPAAAPPAQLFWRGLPATAAGAAAEPYVARWGALLAGRRAQLSLDARGQLERVTFAEDPVHATTRPEIDELTQRWLALTVPLPAEPIGVGARWTAVTVVRQGLGVVKQTARYHLLAVAAGRLTVELDVRRVGEEQPVDAPGLPPGTALELVALFRAVTGKVTLELGHPVPTGELAVEARAHQRLRLADGTARETITEDVGTLALSSTEVPAAVAGGTSAAATP